MVSNIGTQMHSAGAAWQMTLLSASPFLLGLVPTLYHFPMLVLSPVAGAVTDLSDRRRMLITTQTTLLVATAVLSVLTFSGFVTPVSLLALTGMIGVTTVFNANCWHTILQDAISREHLAPAVSLNSISVNTARIVGPALGGMLIAAFGAGSVFLLNSLSFLVIIVTIWTWRESAKFAPKAAQTCILSALREGFGYVLSHHTLALLLLRHLLFMIASYSLIALLPLIVKTRFHLDAKGYGLLAACLGAGAIVSSFTAHANSHRFGVNRVVRAAIALSLSVLLLSTVVSNPILCGVLLFLHGTASTTVALNHGVTVRLSAPPEYVGRVFSYYSFCASGGYALGGFLAGSIASAMGINGALLAAACLSATALFMAFRFAMPKPHPVIDC